MAEGFPNEEQPVIPEGYTGEVANRYAGEPLIKRTETEDTAWVVPIVEIEQFDALPESPHTPNPQTIEDFDV